MYGKVSKNKHSLIVFVINDKIYFIRNAINKRKKSLKYTMFSQMPLFIATT